MTDWQEVNALIARGKIKIKAGDETHFRTQKHLAAQAQSNQDLRGSAGAVAGLIDRAAQWDMNAWDSFHAATGRWPFSAFELPPSMEGCPRWAYERMNLRPPPFAT